MIQPLQPPQRGPTEPRPKSSRKLAGSLLALSSAAVVSVYTVGYVHTQTSLDQLEAAVQTPVATATQPATTQSPPGLIVPRATSAPPSSPTQSLLRDGSFTGMGSSRHGSIQATLVIAGGKIISASVTSCMTRYPCSDVDSLVRAVVQGQAVPTANVSGATDSSRAYKQAVANALAQARSAG